MSKSIQLESSTVRAGHCLAALRSPALMILLLPSAAIAGAPWLLQPSLSVATEYQSNPAYDVTRDRQGSSTGLNLSLPMSFETGRHQFGLAADAQLHDAQGASARNNQSYDADGTWTMSAERGSVSLNASTARSSLIGATRADLGVSRADGYELDHAGRFVVSWQLGERDRLIASAGVSWQRFHVASDTGLLGGRFATTGATYSRSLNPQWQLVLSANGGQSESDDLARRSTNVGFQAGFTYQMDEQSSLNTTAGRNTVRNTATGVQDSGLTYDLTASRQAKYGNFLVHVSRGLQASAFGSLVREDEVTLSYGAALSERLNFGAQMGRSTIQDTFIGFDLDRREYRNASLTLSFALNPNWTASARADYTRTLSSPSLVRSSAARASSIGGSLALTRQFAPVRVL